MTESSSHAGERCRANRPAWQLALLVFVLACAGMARVISNDFVDWDDSLTLYANSRMNPPTAATLRFYWTHAEHGLYIPGTYTVWAALAAVARTAEADLRGAQLDPRVFHSASVIFHALAAVAVFLLLRRLIHRSQNEGGAESGVTLGWNRAELAAAIGALLFALHPVQVESVAWASGLKDVLCAFFAVIALWQYVIAAQATERRTQWIHFSLATAAFLWAMLCKPTAVVVPALAAAVDLVVMRRSWKVTAKWTAPWWPMALACVIVARLAQSASPDATAAWLRPLVALDAIAFYAWKLIWPVSLGIDYGRSPIVALDRGRLYVTWLVPAALAALLVWRPRREMIAAGMLALLALAPVLGLASFTFQYYSTVSDHYLYLALLGPAMGLAWVTMRYRIARPIALVALALFAGKSLAQASHWRDDQALYAHALEVNPDSFLAANNLGNAFTTTADALLVAADLADRTGDRMSAIAYRAQAAEHVRSAVPLFEEAIEKRRKTNRGNDDYLVAHLNLASACSKSRQHERAIAHRARAIELTQRHHAPRTLAGLYFLSAHDLLALNRPQEALRLFEQARQLDPPNPAISEAIDQAKRAVAALPLE